MEEHDAHNPPHPADREHSHHNDPNQPHRGPPHVMPQVRGRAPLQMEPNLGWLVELEVRSLGRDVGIPNRAPRPGPDDAGLNLGTCGLYWLHARPPPT